MRMHSIIPWPQTVFQPARKEEKTQKSKAAEQSLKSFATLTDRVPPPRHELEDDGPPGENIDIVV